MSLSPVSNASSTVTQAFFLISPVLHPWLFSSVLEGPTPGPTYVIIHHLCNTLRNGNCGSFISYGLNDSKSESKSEY